MTGWQSEASGLNSDLHEATHPYDRSVCSPGIHFHGSICVALDITRQQHLTHTHTLTVACVCSASLWCCLPLGPSVSSCAGMTPPPPPARVMPAEDARRFFGYCRLSRLTFILAWLFPHKLMSMWHLPGQSPTGIKPGAILHGSLIKG